jgi:hypothetical protein
LPNFSHRPRNGLLIEATDKSWLLRSSMEAHIRWNFLSGRDEIGRTQGEVMGRRFRPEWFFVSTTVSGRSRPLCGNGVTFTWDDRSLSGIGVPGRITRFQLGMADVSEGDDGLSSFTDRKDFTSYFGIQPFSQTKNKWLRGFLFETGAWFCNVDGRPLGSGDGNTDNGCDRMRIRDHGDAPKPFSIPEATTLGLFTFVSPGISWTVGAASSV